MPTIIDAPASLDALISHCRHFEAKVRAGTPGGLQDIPRSVRDFFPAGNPYPRLPGMWAPLVWLLACSVALTGIDAVILQVLPRPPGEAAPRVLLIMLVNVMAAVVAVIGIVGAARASSRALDALRRMTQGMLLAAAGVAVLAIHAGLFWIFPTLTLLGALLMWLALTSRAFCLWGGYQLAGRQVRTLRGRIRGGS
ncbi:Uncharacterised protein [Bordetella ansorpii]|uniref:Uncharacterized protein n=1 Tax=Bordetella ansorpii TaxID=288768 RepID=A0A157SCL2_9BORD|nr:hypothetical protein [Bordetella ansorpii]SAI67991.1 Uncharacterised protein [Bordetella ansorpii]